MGRIDRDLDLRVVHGTPRVERGAEHEIFRRARPDDDRHPAVLGAACEDRLDREPQRREADAAGDHDDVIAHCILHVPARPERPAQANDVVGMRAAQRTSDGADRAYRVDDRAAVGAYFADRDRDLADTERPAHVELAGSRERKRLVSGGGFQCE